MQACLTLPPLTVDDITHDVSSYIANDHDAFCARFHALATLCGWKWHGEAVTLDAVRGTVSSLRYALLEAVWRSPSQCHWSASTGRVVLNVHVYGRAVVVSLTVDVVGG